EWRRDSMNGNCAIQQRQHYFKKRGNVRGADWRMRQECALLLCIGLGLWITCARHLDAQTPEAVPTLRIEANLTLVDGVAEEQDPITHNLRLLTTLQKTDFRLFD